MSKERENYIRLLAAMKTNTDLIEDLSNQNKKMLDQALTYLGKENRKKELPIITDNEMKIHDLKFPIIYERSIANDSSSKLSDGMTELMRKVQDHIKKEKGIGGIISPIQIAWNTDNTEFQLSVRLHVEKEEVK